MEGKESYYCPITQELMRDPVIDPDGNSYEREAIEDWLSRNSTSPITRRPLQLSDLRPNRALRACIEALVKEDSSVLAASAPRELDHTLAVDLSLSVTSTNSHSMISIRSPSGSFRTPCNVVCVVDVSGSMSAEAKLKGADGTLESFGLSVLDIVKHAVKTIIHNLTADDQLAIVCYHSTARLVFDLKKMNDEGRKQALTALETLVPEGTTNLWDGLHTGLETLRKKNVTGNSTVFLLTDGMPNIVPPRGHVPMLQRYKTQNKDFRFTVNTFGFGYELDSKLLEELATEGCGSYSFIPDSAFVGTIFVNSLSNLLVTVGSNAFLTIECLNGNALDTTNALNTYSSTKVPDGVKYRIGTIQFGQSKDIVIPMNFNYSTPYLRATLEYINAVTGSLVTVSVEASDKCNDDGTIAVQLHRLQAVDAIRRALTKCKSDKDTAQAIIREAIGKLSGSTDDLILDIVKDLEGEVSEALSKEEHFDKWGKHYLPSLLGAHLHQQCNNFKDPGVQHYGGDLFEELRDKIDDVFNTLPPPKPSRNTPAAAPASAASTSAYSPSSPSYSASSFSGFTYAAVPSMAMYNSYSNVCFDGNCSVSMADGTYSLVKDVRKGALVLSPSGSVSRVSCVVKTLCSNNKAQLVELEGGLKLTPYHPVRIQGKWSFPCDLGSVEIVACPAVYSFVLEENHVMVINGVECVTLAHGFTGDNVVSHPYFGTERVLDDLKEMDGWENGQVVLRTGCLVRDTKTGLVSGLRIAPVEGPVY